jgi:hypothetical protein
MPKQAARRRRNASGMQRQVGVAAAYATGLVSRAPVINATRDSCRIVHSELITTLVGAAGFTIPATFQLNPGQRATFPWLAAQAVGWQCYRFNKLVFRYYARCATSTVGSVMLIPDYDAADAAPATEQIASTFEDVAEAAPWKDISCFLRPSAMNSVGPKHFVRLGAVPAGQDIKLFDVGKLFAAQVDGSATVALGKLWVEYDVTFFTPQLPPAGVDDDMLFLTGGGAFTTNAPFGNAYTAETFGISIPTTNGGPQTLTWGIAVGSGLEPGTEYYLSVYGTGTTIATIAMSFPNGATIKTNLGVGVDGAGAFYLGQLTFTATAPVVTFQLALTAATLTSAKLTLIALPPGLSY